MAENFDSLELLIKAQAEQADKALQGATEKALKLEEALRKTAKSATGFDLSGFKKSEGYLKNAAKDLSKSLIVGFKIENEDAQKAIKSLSQDLTKLSAEGGKNFKLTGDVGRDFLGVDNIKEGLTDIITAFHDCRVDVGEEVSQLYNEMLSVSKIKIPENALKELEWANLDGFLKQKLSSQSGLELDTFIKERGLAGKFESFGQSSGLNFENETDQVHILIGLLKQYRDAVASAPKLEDVLVKGGAATQLSDHISEVFDKIAEDTVNASDKVGKFKEKIEELRYSLKGAGSEYATKGKGASLTSAESVEKEITRLEQKLYDLQTKAQLKEVGSKAFSGLATEYIKTENQIDSLKAKLATLNAEKSDDSYLDDVLAKMHEREDAQMAYTETVEESTEAVERLNEEVEKTAKTSASNAASKGTEQLANSAEKATQKYSAFRATIEYIRNTMSKAPTSLFAQMNLTKPKQELTDLQARIEETKEKLLDLNYKFERQSAVRGDKFEFTTPGKLLDFDIKKSEAELASLESKLAALGAKTHEINWEYIGQKGAQAFRAIGNAINSTLGVMGKFVKAIGSKIADKFHEMRKAASKFDITSQGLAKSLLKVSNMFRLMITRMALRGIISEAKNSFSELLEYSEATAESFNKIRNAIHYLADTIAALVSPLLNAGSGFAGLGNIFDSITDKIVGLINKFNQLLSALTGKTTWIKAIKQNKDYRKEVEKTTKAVKGALQPFDELNNITTNQDNGNNPNKDNAGTHFQTLPIDPKWLKFADWLKDMWRKGDGYELGRWLGEKLRDALNSIPWKDIQAKAKKLGKFLATTLNGFFETPGLAEAIGNTIAQTLNTAIDFALEFVKNFHFDSFGKFIGDLIASALGNVRWNDLKELARELGSGIAEAINALVQTDAIKEIGNALGNILRAAVDFVYGIISDIKFDELGKALKEGLNNFFRRMSETDVTGLNGFQKMGKAISDAIIGLLTMLNEVLGDGEIGMRIGRAIADFFGSIDFQTILGQSVKLIVNIAKGLGAAFIEAFKSEDFRKSLLGLGEIIALFFGGKALLGMIGTGIKTLVKNIGLSLAASISSGGLLNTLQAIGSGLLSAIKNFVSVTIPSVLGSIVSVIASFFGGAEIGKMIGYTIFPDDAELYEGYMGIVGTLKLVRDAVLTLGSQLAEWIPAYFNNVAEAARLLVERTKEFFQSILEFAKLVFGSLKDYVVGRISEIGNSIKLKFESIKQFFTNLIANAKVWGHNLVTSIANGILGNNGIAAAIKNKVTEAYNNSLLGRAVSFGQNVVSYIRGKADGGLYQNGKWQPIQRYAAGGLPDRGQMFVARENGAELVGKLGSGTAVMNNDQIVASVSDGVYKAVSAAMSGQGTGNVNVVLQGDASKLFKVIRQEGNDYQRRTGNPVFA